MVVMVLTVSTRPPKPHLMQPTGLMAMMAWLVLMQQELC